MILCRVWGDVFFATSIRVVQVGVGAVFGLVPLCRCQVLFYASFDWSNLWLYDSFLRMAVLFR